MEVAARGCHSQLVAAVFNELRRIERSQANLGTKEERPAIRTFVEKADVVQRFLTEDENSGYRFKPERNWNRYVLVIDEIKTASNGTINRELSLLRAAYNYARKSSPPKVASVPYIQLLSESKPRSGFLSEAQYDALASECAKVGLWIRTIFEIAYSYGWRRAEVSEQMTVAQYDREHGVLRLNPGDTKNKEGRVVPVTQKLRQLLDACVEDKKTTEPLITRPNGKPVADFRKQWESICTAAGVPGLYMHDLRRSAARRMRKLGVHESVIMKVAGWKSRSLFDRYNITDQSDVQDAVRKMDAAAQTRSQQPQLEKKSDFSPSLAPVGKKSAGVKLERNVN
jgi:integrase